MAAGSLCPLIELLHICPTLVSERLSNNQGLQLNQFTELITNVLRGTPAYQSTSRNIEYSSLSLFSDENTVWTALAIAIKKAARRAGFSDAYSGQFAGAIAELHDNIVEHSEHVISGYIVYAASPGRFEFVVADKGIGVLRGLRDNPTYIDLTDAGLALEKALTYGVSRTGIPGSGTGFKPTIEGLANISHWMRFRSGDHARSYLRDNMGEIEARTRQKAPIDGLVISVSCDASMT